MAGAEVLAAEPVAESPLRLRISAWWMSRSIIAVATTSSPKISPQARERLVARDDHRRALVAGADEREHQVRGLRGRRVCSRPRRRSSSGISASAASSGLELALALCVAEPGDPFGRGRELDALAGEAGADRRARWRGVSCRCPGGPSRITFWRPCRKSSWPRCSIDCLLDRALEGEVELLERLARREPGGLDPCLAAVAVARGDLGLRAASAANRS